jgi:flagellar M-ring protein FliF
VKAALDGLKALGPARLAALAAVGLGVMGMLAFLILRGGTEQMALLYGDLDLKESAQVVEQLGRQHIPYRIGGQGSQILVPVDQVPRARLLLAREGLPSGGSIGYEIFDRGDGLAATQFQQTINETRALEGELARTIRAMDGIRAVRVHLVLPKREPFAREAQEARASVMLTMAGAQRLDREGVQAILNLVAAAVPGLRPQNIAIADSHGSMLARAGEPVSAMAGAQSAEELRHATELRLSRAVEEMLERTLGPGRVRAEAAVEMDFDRVNETLEKYDPDGQVVRSTQTVNSTSKTTESSGTVSVQNNLPNADAGKENGSGSQEGRQEETTNYEIGRTVRTLIREQPQIHRISLAVMVDGVDAPGPDGRPVWQARPAEELARIATLVRSAIGYDEKRGDHVDVVSMRFVAPEEPAAPERGGILGVKFEKSDLVRLAETALFGVLALLGLLLVLRPMVLRLTTLPAGALGMDAALAAASAPGALTGPGGVPAFPGMGGGASLAAPPVAGLIEDESMMNLANVEGQMRASSIRRIAGLVEKHPDETLAIVRGWMAEEPT